MFICTKKQIQKVVRIELCYDDSEQNMAIELKRGDIIRVVFIKNNNKYELGGKITSIRDNLLILDASYGYDGGSIGILYTSIRELEILSLEEDEDIVTAMNKLKSQVDSNTNDIDTLNSVLQWDKPCSDFIEDPSLTN